MQEYRARRRAKGLCIEAGCDRRVRKYARCADCRRNARESAMERNLIRGQSEREEIQRLQRELNDYKRLWKDFVSQDRERET
jgi:hypothetical protein